MAQPLVWEEVDRGDLHSAKIKENRLGIVNGAIAKRRAKVITEGQKREIIAIAERAETNTFRPLIYVIPYAGVARLVTRVEVAKRAHPLAEELIIERLPRKLFDTMELRRR